MNEIKMNEMEEMELTLVESEKVAGGVPTHWHNKWHSPKKSKENSQTDGDGSVSGSGSW